MTTITPPVRNGIDTAQLYGTLDAIKADADLAHFEFRVHNRWVQGPHSRSTIHGLDDEYRNGFERIRVSVTVKGDAPREKLQEIVDRTKARSVVYDMLTNGVPVEVH